ncbi:MAG: hypothetical protein LUC32_00120 [Clostridiales bacterium]|nr:hypothetical protein [Clostridiales bacterium]
MSDRQRKPLKPDTVVKNYWSGNEEFADLFNAVLFQGKPVIHPAELTSTDTDSSTVREHGGSQGTLQSVEGSRDNIKIHKRAASHGVELVLLGLENQERIHYAMPIRVMGYDHSVYQKQYNENAKKFRASLKSKGECISEDEFLSGMRRSDRFVPVVTVVIYYEEKSWVRA